MLSLARTMVDAILRTSKVGVEKKQGSAQSTAALEWLLPVNCENDFPNISAGVTMPSGGHQCCFMQQQSTIKRQFTVEHAQALLRSMPLCVKHLCTTSSLNYSSQGDERGRSIQITFSQAVCCLLKSLQVVCALCHE